MDWTGSEHSTLAGSCENCNKPTGLIKCWEFVDHTHTTTICFSRTVFHKNYLFFHCKCKLITKQIHYSGTDADCCHLQLLYSANTTSTFIITWATSCVLMYNVPQNMIHDKINAAFLEIMFNFYPAGVGMVYKKTYLNRKKIKFWNKLHCVQIKHRLCSMSYKCDRFLFVP